MRLFWFFQLFSLCFASWTARGPVNESEWEQFFKPRTMHVTPLPVAVPPTEHAKALPRAIDWSFTLGPVRDQGQCGSCWAFATLGALESRLFHTRRQKIDLSEQQLVDCVVRNFGCRGGYYSTTLQYLRQVNPCPESIYPYKGKNGVSRPCNQLHRHRVCRLTRTRIQKYTVLASESQILQALQRGPVMISMRANALLYTYASGVFDGPCAGVPNHAVLVVGYNETEAGIPYWIIRNSWGTAWGDQGILWLLRGRNQCGIGRYQSFQIVA